MLFKKKPKQKWNELTHRCKELGCEQSFANEAELITHENDAPHCSYCGFGYTGLPGVTAISKLCLACSLDKASMPTDKIRIQ